ncbi:hypothetical protein [Saccharothrix sp. ST-888]|uniref:hypothetical protein n=1 Tax=Saccharothrix sp. ST-888 TaxID=1427391 RepID=UPI0005EC407A|nr:hypothetical protein [Saccharothrix sp. ST-888]KJK55356.1 hypothetical protein UK12_29230 [Saccharothrix sp. ST-888]
MTTVAALIKRIRSEVGDLGSPFVDTYLGGDELSSYDLSETNVAAATVAVTAGTPPRGVLLVPGVDYVLDQVEGRIVLISPGYSPLHHGQSLRVEGRSQGMFSDDDLSMYVSDALAQHTYGRTIQVRYRDERGFIHFTDQPFTVETLPPVEEPLVAYLAAINVLWTLATDAATDVDIVTAEGTVVRRSERYQQLMAHIGTATTGLTGRYNQLSQQLNVGLGRIEMFNLRRVSRTTNRLVPEFREREYDDVSLPKRLLPPVDGEEYEDTSGIPSPVMPGVWG